MNTPHRQEYLRQWRRDNRKQRAEYQRQWRSEQNVKPCIKCKKTKSLDDFIPDPRFRDGHRNICRPCFNAKQREYHEKRKASGIQLDLIPGKIAANNHRGYPPDNKCPCRQCREQAQAIRLANTAVALQQATGD